MLGDSSTTADVQAELQDYLNSKNINNLFIQIVESLLIEKPDNPIGFIVEYLQKKFPEETTMSATGGPNKSVDRGAAAESKAQDSDYSDSESEDDDEVGDMDEPPPPLPAAGGRARRVSVSAESFDPNKVDQNTKKIPKSAEETKRIMEILTANVIFQALDESQLERVKDAMFSVEHGAGDIVIQQGDDGDNFYVIDDGQVDIFVKDKETGDDKKVLELSQGDSFGELAIMYNAPRAATCKASTTCKFWALDRVSFKVIVMHTTINRRNLYKSFLKQVPILQTLTEYEVLTIADALSEEKFGDGDVICEQGMPGNTFYIVKEGTAICYTDDARGTRVERARVDVGAYFGEIALLENKPRQATVIASGELKVLTLDRRTFKRVMGPLDEILKRNMAHWNRVVAGGV